MTDEEVDTSDIPPLDDAFFASAKWRLPRLYIYLNDLRDARRFAAFIVKQKLHEEKKTKVARARQELVRLALNTSLIVSYSRPFKGSNNLKGQGKSSLVGHEREVLKEGEIKLHRRILALRDHAYAHSDANSHLFEGLDYTKYVAFMRPVDILDKSEIKTLKIMIERWISHLELEKSKLKDSLKRRA